MSSNQISPRVPVVEAESDLVNAARMPHHQVEARLTSGNNMKKKATWPDVCRPLSPGACWVNAASYLVVHDGT